MQRFRTVLRYLPRYRVLLALGLGSVVVGQLLQNYAPFVLRAGLREIESGLGSPAGVATRMVGLLALGYLGVMVLRSFFLWSMRICTISVSRRIERDLRQDFFVHLESLDHRFYVGQRTGDLMSRATADLEAVRSALGPAVMYITNSSISVPVALAAMVTMDWGLTLFATIPLVAIAVTVKLLAPRIMRYSRRVQDVMGELSSQAQENFAGVRVVKAYTMEDTEQETFDRVSQEYVEANLALARNRGLMTGIIRGGGSLGALVVLGYCGLTTMGYSLSGGVIDLGTLVAFQAYQISLVWPMMAFGWVFAMFQRGAAALDRINAIMEVQPAVTDPEEPAPVTRLQGAISVRNLTYAHPGGEPVLREIDLEIPAGATVGIVGPMGAGKSTLTALLTHTYPIERGCIFFDGVDLADLPLGLLRRHVAVVPQEPFLFSRTIQDNITYGLDGDGARWEERVQAAARVAALEQDVGQFPEGFQTRVGERGLTLSGGQQQRVAIARAVVREPTVLILDDCLSAVDTRTERAILGSLQGVIDRCTSLIISHRLSAVCGADEILVLEAGEVRARGTHDELLRRGGYYAETWRRQSLEEELEELD